MSNLLCVDFDYFFYNPLEAGRSDDPNLLMYDWGHSETPLMLSNLLWSTRAMGFFQNGLELPQVTVPDGGWEKFWSRFKFADTVTFEYADSNSLAGLIEPPDGDFTFEEVVLFDAHHDSGYRVDSVSEFLLQESFSCEDWMLVHQSKGTEHLTVRYPQWKPRGVKDPLPDECLTVLTIDDGEPLHGIVFDAVFVCRSGAWVPAWCDGDFTDFIAAAPFPGTQVDDEELDRGFDVEAARATGEQMRKLMEEMKPS